MDTTNLKCDMKGKGVCPLPLENLLDVFRKKWALSLLTTIGNFEKLHFNAIHERIKDKHTKKITSKILSARLKDLEKFGLVEKRKYDVYPYIVNYSLTAEGKRFYKTFLDIGNLYAKV